MYVCVYVVNYIYYIFTPFLYKVTPNSIEADANEAMARDIGPDNAMPQEVGTEDQPPDYIFEHVLDSDPDVVEEREHTDNSESDEVS